MRSLAAIFAVTAGLPASAQMLPLDHPAVGYSSLPLTDPVAELSRKIERGSENRLAFDPVYGYLPALLKALDIPVESQMAVFSKTSIQSLRIEPSNPRVLFFNDAVVVGWVRGGFIELASQDPIRGMIFYRLEQRPPANPAPGAAPESPFIRHEDCLRCHLSPVTGGVPGALLRSVFPSVSGVPVNHAPQYDTDSRTPLAKLWGGWYVTGDTGPELHMGNLIAVDEAHPESMLQAAPLHLDSLEGKCPPGARLTAYSDIVALLVFQHQMRVMNLLTRASWESRIALAETGSLSAAAHTALNDLSDGLLFAGEAPLQGQVSGTAGFTEAFADRGPRDSRGRSLRDLSLKGRLMRYRCSYVIYSAAFDALPDEAREAVYRRMWQALSVQPAADRKATVEILRETKPGLPAYFQP